MPDTEILRVNVFTLTDWELREYLRKLTHRLFDLERKHEQMALDITGLQKGVSDVASAVQDVAAELKNNPDQATIDSLATQLESAATQLETIAGKTPAPVNPAPAPVAVGSTISLPVDPADPSGPAADHTVTAVSADGSTVTAQPVSGGDPVTVPADTVTPATN